MAKGNGKSNGKRVTNQMIVNILVDDTYPTMQKKATELGYETRQSLYDRIKNNPSILEDVRTLTLDIAKSRNFKIIDALIRKAVKGDVSAINTYLKYTGQLIDKVESKNETNVTVDLSEELTNEQTEFIAKSILDNGGETE